MAFPIVLLLRIVGLSLFVFQHNVCVFAETPGAVQNLYFSDIRQWGFKANWDPPSSGNSPVLYNVSVTNGNNGEVYEVQFPPNIHGSYVIDHLYDDTLYFVSVIAVDALNTAGTSTSSTVLVPSCELCIIETGRTYLKMRLRPPLPFPAYVSGYAIDSSTADNAMDANLLGGSEQVLISKLQPGVLYQFDVKNNNTDEVVYMSRYRVAPDPVENLEIGLVSRASCIVTYVQPPINAGQKIDGYRIVYKPTNSGKEDVLLVDSKSTSVLIEDLMLRIEYTIEVRTFSGQNADLLYSSGQNATVVRADFAMTGNSNTSLTLHWELPSDGHNSSFQLQYGLVDHFDVDYLSLNASVNSVTITGLQPGQEYMVVLYLVFQEGVLSFISSAVFQTEPNAVNGITWTATASSISLTWNHPVGKADSFIIEYEPSSTTAPLVTDRLSLKITGLSRGLFYMVNVTTVFGTYRSSPTTVYVQTDTLSPGEFEVDSVTSDSIGITYGAIPDTIALHFTINPDEGDQDEIMANQRVEFFNLTSGKLFSISLLNGSALVENGSQSSSIDIRTVPIAPSSLAVTPLESDTNMALRLSWTTPPKGEWDRIRITVSQDGVSKNDVLTDKTATSYDLKNLRSDTLYMIGISSVSGLDSTQQESDPVIQQATTSNLPDGTLMITAYDLYSVTVDWHWPPAVSCIALCREVGREMGEDYKGVINPSSTSIMTFTYDYLIPGRNYEFLIRRTDDNRFINVFQRTVPSSPARHNTFALGADSINVLWSETQNDFERFEITAYPSRGGNGIQSVIAVAGDVNSTTLDGLMEDTNYTTEVRTLSGSGQSLEKSLPSISTTVTEIVIMEVLTLSIETVIPVGFIPVSGSFDAYRYGYRTVSDGQFSYTALSRTAPPYFEIKQLRPGALYEITLDIETNLTYTEIDRIQTRTKPSKPTILPVTSLEDTSFTVNWILPSHLEGDFIGCYLSYEPKERAIDSTFLLDPSLTSYTLTGLEPATSYVITLVTVSGEGSSEQISFPETATVTTADGIPGGVNIKEVTGSLIRITWNKVSGVFSYTPQIHPDEGKVSQDTREATFDGLTPGQLYSIFIQWIGNSGPAIQLYTQPNPPVALTITRTAASELDISWGPPTLGYYDSYILCYSRLLKNDIVTVDNLDSEDLSITLNHLLPETSYEISVSAVRGTKPSDPVKVSGTTGRRIVDDLTLFGRTTTTISVTWSASDDPSSEEYEMWIRPTGEELQLVATLQPPTDDYTFTNLISGTSYLIRLVLTGLNRTEELEVTTYPQTPGFIHIIATTQTSITFSWEKAAGNFDCYGIFFFELGSEAAFLQDVPRGDNLTISKNFLTADTMYKIQIYTKTGSTTSASTETTASSDIELLVFEKFGNLGLRITWENAIEADYYFLEKFFTNGMTNEIMMTTEKHIELSNTIPGQPYTFRLSSGEKPVNDRQKLGEATYVLAPLAPSVTVRNLSPTSVIVRITADRLGVVNRFVVDTIAHETSLPLGRRTSISLEIQTEACPEVNLINLIPGSEYTVQVTAIAEEKRSDSTTVNISLDPLEPGVVFLNEKTSTSIEVIWGAVTDTLKNYVVYLISGLTRLQTNRHGINEDHKSYFEGLIPGSQYTIALLLEFEGGGLIQRSILSVTTTPEPPKNLTFLSVSGQEVTLGWATISSNIGHYELCWTPNNEVLYPSKDSTQADITLQPLDAEYTISLYAVTGEGADKTRSRGVSLGITLSKDEMRFTESSTSSSVEMTEGVSVAIPATGRKDTTYIIIGTVLGFIPVCLIILVTLLVLKRRGKRRPAMPDLDYMRQPIQIPVENHEMNVEEEDGYEEYEEDIAAPRVPELQIPTWTRPPPLPEPVYDKIPLQKRPPPSPPTQTPDSDSDSDTTGYDKVEVDPGDDDAILDEKLKEEQAQVPEPDRPQLQLTPILPLQTPDVNYSTLHDNYNYIVDEMPKEEPTMDPGPDRSLSQPSSTKPDSNEITSQDGDWAGEMENTPGDHHRNPPPPVETSETAHDDDDPSYCNNILVVDVQESGSVRTSELDTAGTKFPINPVDDEVYVRMKQLSPRGNQKDLIYKCSFVKADKLNNYTAEPRVNPFIKNNLTN